MTTKDDGGPAFPSSCTSEGHSASGHVPVGMSLRDYFAAAIATGMCSDAEVLRLMAKDKDATPFARQVYEIADAVLRAPVGSSTSERPYRRHVVLGQRPSGWLGVARHRRAFWCGRAMTAPDSSLMDLVARLEKATGPADELDRDIALAIGWDFTEYRAGGPSYCWRSPAGMYEFRPPLSPPSTRR